MAAAPGLLQTLVDRFDPSVFDARRPRIRIRLAVPGDQPAWDVVVADGTAALVAADGRPDAELTADAEVWHRIAADLSSGMHAYRAGRLIVRRNLHAGIGFLAATSGDSGAGRLRYRRVATGHLGLSILEAGVGPPIVAVHGLGGTKSSFLPTVAALADRFRVIAVDLPGFGDSDKPVGAAYDARFFAQTVADLIEALALDRAHLVGNSLGGRVALEVAMRRPETVGRLGLLAPALAWLRDRKWLSVIRVSQPVLGLVQPTSRSVVEAIVHQVIPGSDQGWAAAGVDEFLRAYMTPPGRVAFYAAARQLYLDEPFGEDGFWPRLEKLGAPALFVWGRRDTLVPLGFARHVAAALPRARHLELDCGHVPQIERPRETHAALAQFLAGDLGAEGESEPAAIGG
jgi:pimeloyl-ACP methyl ester carboxylesterase